MRRTTVSIMCVLAALAAGCGSDPEAEAEAAATAAKAAPAASPAIPLKPGQARVEREPPGEVAAATPEAWDAVEQHARRLRERTESLLERTDGDDFEEVARAMGQVQASLTILVHHLGALEAGDEVARRRQSAMLGHAERLLQGYEAMLEDVAPPPTPTPAPSPPAD